MNKAFFSLASSIRLGLVAGCGVLLGCLGYDESAGNSVESTDEAVSSAIENMGTTTDKDQGGNLEIDVPRNAKAGDLLLLFLYRTDDPNIWNTSTLKDRMKPYSGWNGPLATCAIDNSAGDLNCSGNQADLNQVVFWKKASADDLGDTLDIDMPGGHPAWAIMMALRGASTSNPLRNIALQTRCDNKKQTVFPSVSGGRKGDLLLLSQVFDDGENTGVNDSSFKAPSGLTRFAHVIDNDEAGHLFGEILRKDGTTPSYTTEGSGASSCKDAAISLLIRPSGG